MTLAGLLDRVERSARRGWASDSTRLVIRTLYYLAVIVAVALVQSHGHFTPPPFVYQGF